MSPAAPLGWEQLKEIIEDEKKTDKGAQDVQEQLEKGEVVFNLDNSSLVVNCALDPMNKEFEQHSLDESVRLRNTHPIRQSKADRLCGEKCQFQASPESSFCLTRFGESRSLLGHCFGIQIC